MFEFTEAYLSPFKWAQQAYKYMLTDQNQTLQITREDLTSDISSLIDQSTITILTHSDWNMASLSQMSILGGMYESIDQGEKYYNGLFTAISSRLSESERRIQEQEANLKVLLSASRLVASTSVHLKGGDSSTIETNEKYYRYFGPLESVPNEGIFRLKDTGFFSSLRSLGGFAGQVEIDESLGETSTNGDLRSVADGSRSTFWASVFHCPSLVRADQNDVPWLPREYKHGYACVLTYYMDRPTLATELFVDPVTTEPMDVVSISWTPMDTTSTIQNGSFSTSAYWQYTSSTAYVSSSLGLGVASGGCVVAHNTSGWVSQTFPVSGNYLASGSVDLVSLGNRCQIHYSMRGIGNLLAGARIVWFNVSGDIIDYKIKEDYPSSFFVNYRLVDYIPAGAVSGRIDVGIFTATSSASAYFDNVEVITGERTFLCQESIDRPKTISLPEIVRSSRFSFVLSQRNPRREVISKESVKEVANISNNLYLDTSLQNATTDFSKSLTETGPGTVTFAYRLGAKELDLRYREHIPRGSIVSLPLFTRREIRNLWATAEIGQFFNDNVSFYIYPFADNSETKIQIQPFAIGDVDGQSSTLIREGEILRIYTSEEVTAGWTNPLDVYFITNPKKLKESFNGTTREGKVRLEFAPHLRRVYLRDVQDWLKDHSIWSSPFDPNLETIYGLPESMQSTKDDIRSGNIDAFDLDDLISKEGYIPIKVTVATDKWTAVPDIYGRPDISKVRTALLEELSETTIVETSVDVNEDYVSFDSWMASTSISDFIALKESSQSGASSSSFFYGLDSTKFSTTTIKQAYDILVKRNGTFKRIYDTFFRATYELLRGSGKLSKNSGSSKTTTAAVEIDDIFSTRYKPIITGPGGSFIQLYWFNETTNYYTPMPRSAYEIKDPTLGLIRVLQSPPSSGFTSILADYKYISYTEVEDHFGSVITFATPTSSVTGATSVNIGSRSKPFPITRNMTDYEDGKIPTLRLPNFDRLSKDYYPVIEYYINSEGEIIFSRDFFRYGDIPATISVEYDTLAIQPRVGVEVTRSGSPSATPTISNVSLRVRESSPLPTREIN